MNIDIVIPVYNESLFLKDFLASLMKEKAVLKSIRHIILVDDGSTDQTHRIARSLKHSKMKIMRYSPNKGKGFAMRVGLEAAKKNHADAVIFMDGDRQHLAKHLPRFIKGIQNNKIIFGYRQLTKNTPYFRKLGNKVAKHIFKALFNIKRHDILCGYMALRKDIFDEIAWKSDDYGVEVEISAIVGKKRITFKEVLIDTIYLDMKKGVTLTKAFFISLKIPYWYFKFR